MMSDDVDAERALAAAESLPDETRADLLVRAFHVDRENPSDPVHVLASRMAETLPAGYPIPDARVRHAACLLALLALDETG